MWGVGVPLKSYRELLVWKEGVELAVECYRLTAVFPREELYGLTSQIRRASTSIPANVAEGYGRGTRKGYLQFLYVAQGSLKELETHLIVAGRVGRASSEQINEVLAICDTLGRRLAKLIQALQARPAL